MISKLTGAIDGLEDDGSAVVDVNGVGYKVVVHDRDQETLGRRTTGTSVVVYTRYIVKEESVTIYGFLDLDDRKAFDAILEISGMGVATAIRILSVIPGLRLRELVAEGDMSPVLKVPGVGSKMATKLQVSFAAKWGR